MKIARSLFLAVLCAGAFAAAGAAATSISAGIHVGPSGRATVDVGFFYDDLASYGNWVERPRYGWVWMPRVAASSWRPYEDGHWVWTDEGWTWISDEPYGWATYHYGRWYDDPDYGWEWIPGDEWAPAWVSWQEGGDYIGWAPLPPDVDYRGAVDVRLAPEAYVFVPEREILAPRIASYVVPPREVVRFFSTTRNITQYWVTADNRIYNIGVPVERVQRATGRAVPRYQIADLQAGQRHAGPRVTQNRVEIFRPTVQRATVAPPPQRPQARSAVLAPQAAQTRARQNQARRQPVPSPQLLPPQTGQNDNGQRRHGRAAQQPELQTVPQPVPEQRARQSRPNRPVQVQQVPPPEARQHGRPAVQEDRNPQPRAQQGRPAGPPPGQARANANRGNQNHGNGNHGNGNHGNGRGNDRQQQDKPPGHEKDGNGR